MMPLYFKRPHEFYTEERSERRVLVRQSPEPVGEPSGSSEDASCCKVSDASTQYDSTSEEIDVLKRRKFQLMNEVHRLQTTLQRLDPALLSNAQLYTYTGLNINEMLNFLAN